MKKIFTLSLLVGTCVMGAIFTSLQAQAQVQQKFPLQIEEYTLDSSSVRFDSHCDPYLGETLCQEYWWAYYIGPKNKQVGVYMLNVSKGINSYKQNLASGKKIKLDSNTVYKNEGEIAWILADETTEDNFKFNTFKTLEVNFVESDKYNNFIADKNAKGNNPVTKYFIDKYPSEVKTIKKNDSKNITKNMELKIVSPKKKEQLIAGEQYEIKWKSKNLPSNSEILFQLMYGSQQTSFGNAVSNTGRYVWTVPVQYALNKTEFAPYKLVGYVTGFDGKNQIVAYSDWFYILPGNSKEIYPILIDTHTEDEIWKWGTTQTIQWRELNSVTSYTVSLIKEGEEKGEIIKKTKANVQPFIQQAKWKIDKKTKPGKYYWKIEGFNKKKLVAENKSDVFEIIE